MQSHHKVKIDKPLVCGLLFIMNKKSFIDLCGKQFGYLIIVSLFEGNCNSNYIWECKCKCGRHKKVRGADLQRGATKSCGCLQKERASQAIKTHGKRHTTEYNSWAGMKERCYNKNSHKYHVYGGRGIFVCDRWLNSFEMFYEDMGLKPSPRHSLDRVNVNGNYEPKNCRWALPKVQSRNKTDNHFIEYDGKNLTMAEWSDVTGISQDAIGARLNYYGWSIKDALTIKDGRKNKRKV